MAQTPRILKNFNAFVNGRGLAGIIDEVDLPEVEINTDEHRAGGMDASVELDMGQKAMTVKIVVSDPDPTLLALVGSSDANSARLVLRGSFVRDSDSARVAVIAEISGRFKKGSFGTWKAGDKGGQTYECGVTYYRLIVGGVEVYEIDVENMIRRIGGVDQLAGIRNDIGLN